jgi:hypothetical protein
MTEIGPHLAEAIESVAWAFAMSVFIYSLCKMLRRKP